MKARILVADDHAIVRDGLREAISRAPGMSVVAEAADGSHAGKLALGMDLDLIVLDISLPGSSGFDVLKDLRTSGSKVPVLFFSMHPAAQYADYARRAGAQGFLSKSATSSEVIATIWKLLKGGRSFPGEPSPARGRQKVAGPFAALSQREMEVMLGLVNGEAAAAIAARLDVSPKSISTYRRRVLEKLSVGSNAEMAILVSRHGIP